MSKTRTCNEIRKSSAGLRAKKSRIKDPAPKEALPLLFRLF
jgi:hypothetical protein